MAFSLPFFRKRTAGSSRTPTKKNAKPLSHSASLSAVTAVTHSISSSDIVGSVAVNGVDLTTVDGVHLVRLDSFADANMADLGVSNGSQQNVSPQRSSQLSKTLDEVLRDKDALAYFISYLKVRNADSLARFWLNVEAFRLSAIERISRPRQSQSRSSGDMRDRGGVTSHPDQLTVSSENSVSGHPTAASKRASSNDCGHSGSASADSPKMCGKLLAHGEVTQCRCDVSCVSHNCTDSHLQGVLIKDGPGCTVVDHCLASHPSAVERDTKCLVLECEENAEESLETIQKGIERDAVAIFSKYLSPDCPHPIGITEELRAAAVRRVCSNDGRGVDPGCFSDCQSFVVKILETEHFPGFRQSVYHCKHQIDVLTGSQIYLNDILYDDTAFSYFTEFMEGEEATELLQCFLDLDNFGLLLSDMTSSGSSHQFQDDAMIIYDKYFSLQATRSLRFEDRVRQEVESNICRDEGPAPDCFCTPKNIVFCHLERTYLPLFLKSELYFKYLSELINTVQLAQDMVVFPRKRRASDSASERSMSSAGADSISTRNTLLAMDTRGQHIKRAVNKIGDDLRIDSSLFDPDNLWQRPNASSMTFGRVSQLGEFISDFDPEPDREKKGLSSLFSKKSEKARMHEEMALQVAQMIINDITSTTLGQGGNAEPPNLS